MGSEDARLRSATSAQDRATLRANMDATLQRTKELQEKLSAQEELLAQGLVTKDTVQGTRQQLRLAEATLKSGQADMQRVTLSSFSAARANDDAFRADKLRYDDSQRQIKLLEDKLAQSAADTGRIVELRAGVGDVVRNGTAIASLERAGSGLEALLYVDSREGKSVRPGMFVEVSPSVVRRERHGSIVGKVRAVEDFPSTRSGIMRVLRNEQLVDTLLAETAGAPIAIRAELVADPASPSHYRWTSGRGPDIQLTSGTRLIAFVVTRTQRPLALVFPMLDSGR
jgi:HlyD family secretion protein